VSFLQSRPLGREGFGKPVWQIRAPARRGLLQRRRNLPGQAYAWASCVATPTRASDGIDTAAGLPRRA